MSAADRGPLFFDNGIVVMGSPGRSETKRRLQSFISLCFTNVDILRRLGSSATACLLSQSTHMPTFRDLCKSLRQSDLNLSFTCKSSQLTLIEKIPSQSNQFVTVSISKPCQKYLTLAAFQLHPVPKPHPASSSMKTCVTACPSDQPPPPSPPSTPSYPYRKTPPSASAPHPQTLPPHHPDSPSSRAPRPASGHSPRTAKIRSSHRTAAKR